MRFHPRAQGPIIGVFLLVFAPGCLSTQKPVSIRVIDAETQQPITAAEARIIDPQTQPFKPSDTLQPVDKNGIAHLQATASLRHPVVVEVFAKGYQRGDMILSDAAVNNIPSAHWFEDTDRRAPNDTVKLYSGEPFTVELVIPLGYRGVIKAEVELRDDIPCPPGKRRFSSVVSPTGAAQVIGPSVLKRVPAASYLARYNDGSALDGRMDAAKTGFRWLKQDGKFELFVVGTQNEYDALRRQYCPDLEEMKEPPQRSAGGHGGMGGGGMGGGIGGRGVGNGFGGY